MAHPTSRTPPLAGRPPFATDDEDEIYSTPHPQRRIMQKPGPDLNSRSSAYNVYDQYIDDAKRQSGAGTLGMDFMNGNMDSDDDDDEPNYKPSSKHSALAAATHPQAQTAIPLASPRPGYAAPIAALNLARPSPAATPEVRQQPPPVQMLHAQRQMQVPQSPRQMQMPQRHPQVSQPQMALLPQTLRLGAPGSGRGPPSPHHLPTFHGPSLQHYTSSPTPSSVPSTPHPLEEPITPITPAFLRPSKPSDNVKFASELIMRGNSEDHLLPRRGDKGDDFWRRFSMVAKEEGGGRESSWLVKTQNGTTRLSRWIWIVGMFLMVCIATGIGVGWYFSHKNPPNQQPKVFGGSADEGISSSAAASSFTSVSGISSSPHVSPTNTVARRASYPEPAPTHVAFQILRLSQAESGLKSFNRPHFSPPKRHSRHVNRTWH